MAMNNYMNHVWVNNVLQPIALNLTPNVTQMMRGEWSLPSYFVPIQNLNLATELTFYTPKVVTNISPIFMPWGAHVNQTMS